MKKYLTIIMAITLLITGTGVGFCKESKKTEMQNSQTLNEEVKSNVSKREKINAVLFLVCTGLYIGATIWTGKIPFDNTMIEFAIFGGYLYFCSLAEDCYKTFKRILF